jgi:hypothetical protein
LLSAFYQWKKQPEPAYSSPNFFDFYRMAPLCDAEKLFYQAGLDAADAIAVLDRHVDRLEEFARYIIAHVHASVRQNRDVLTNAPFIASLSLRNTVFDPVEMAASYAAHADSRQKFMWNLDPHALENWIGWHSRVSDPVLLHQSSA